MIISLGTNDHKGVQTKQELEAIRSRINADRVYWILPPCNEKFCKPNINKIVESIAKNRGDFIIRTERLQADAIHPSRAGYKELVEQTR
jgi:lysophospholipase L1-like esterase